MPKEALSISHVKFLVLWKPWRFVLTGIALIIIGTLFSSRGTTRDWFKDSIANRVATCILTTLDIRIVSGTFRQTEIVIRALHSRSAFDGISRFATAGGLVGGRTSWGCCLTLTTSIAGQFGEAQVVIGAGFGSTNLGFKTVHYKIGTKGGQFHEKIFFA